MNLRSLRQTTNSSQAAIGLNATQGIKQTNPIYGISPQLDKNESKLVETQLKQLGVHDFSLFEPQVDDLNSKRRNKVDHATKQFGDKVHEGDYAVPVTESNYDME